MLPMVRQPFSYKKPFFNKSGFIYSLIPSTQSVTISSYFTARYEKKLLIALQYVLFLGFGIFLVWWSIHKMDEKNWNDCVEAMKSARYILVIPVFIIISASHVSRAIRWKILMKPMGYNPRFINTFFAVMIGYLPTWLFPGWGKY